MKRSLLQELVPLARRRVEPLCHGHVSPWVQLGEGGPFLVLRDRFQERGFQGARFLSVSLFMMDWYLFAVMSVIWLSLS